MHIHVLASLLAALAAAQHHDAPAAKANPVEEAGELFRSSCTRCHQAPDLAFATDRAWLTQVLDTA